MAKSFLAKFFRTSVLVMVFVGMFSGTASALDNYWNDANTKNVWLTENGETKIYVTKASTIGGFLVEENIAVGENDIIDFKLDTELMDDYVNKLTIIRSINVTLYVDSVPQPMNLPAGSKVGNAIGRLPKMEGLEYNYFEKPNDPLVDGSVLKVKTIRTETTVEESIAMIPFETEYVDTEDLEKGVEQVSRDGMEGEMKIITEIVFVNGSESERTVTEEVITEPVNRIINRGTKVKPVEPPPAPKVAPQKESASQKDSQGRTRYVMEATAYTADYNSTGKNPGDPGFGITASGMKARVGVVAVDPKVIPLGTKMYIEGYGDAIAGDTGSGIYGNRVDLYFDTNYECIQWGRRNVVVYVLNE